MSNPDKQSDNYEVLPSINGLGLRTLNLGHLYEFSAAVEESRDYLERFLPWARAIRTRTDFARFIQLMAEERALGNSYSFGLFKESRLVGHIALMHVLDAKRSAEIGYWVSEDQSNFGLTTAAADRITQFGLEEMRLDQILIRADVENVGSNRIAQKLGYELVDTAPDPMDDNRMTNFWIINQS